MNNIFIPYGTLEYIGSKERLQKTVTRSGGKLLPGQGFQVTIRALRNRPFSAAFRFRSSYTQTSQGFQLSYRIYPTTATLIRYIAVLLLLFSTWIAAFAIPEVANASRLSILILPILMCCHWNNCKSCEKTFRKLFSAVTGSHQESTQA